MVTDCLLLYTQSWRVRRSILQVSIGEWICEGVGMSVDDNLSGNNVISIGGVIKV